MEERNINVLLPPEIFHKIFGSVDKNCRKNASLVCRYWLNLIRNDVKFSSDIKMMKNVEKCDIEKMLSNWPVLKTLEIEMAYKEWIKDIEYPYHSLLERVTIYADFSKEFSMTYNSVDAIIFNPKDTDIMKTENILKITLADFPEKGDKELNRLMKICDNAKNLKMLNIEVEIGMYPVDDDFLEEVLDKIGPSIKHLDFTGHSITAVESLDLDHLIDILEMCTNLVSVTIDGETNFCELMPVKNDKLFYVHLFTQIPKLQKVIAKITASSIRSMEPSKIKVLYST